MSLSGFFVDPASLPSGFDGTVQLGFLAIAYGYILFRASGIIASSSELLTLVLDPGLVGGFLLPVLGAVPDGAIVLASGLGADAAVRLAVGVGALAGSTVLLLTLPWAACIALGRVDLSPDGSARYSARPKLTPGGTWTAALLHTGVQTTSAISSAAVLMLCTAASYLVAQVPAWAGGAATARGAALAGLIASLLCFVGYSAFQVFSSRSHEMQEELQASLRRDALAQRLLQVTTVIELELDREARRKAAASAAAGDGGGPLLLGASSFASMTDATGAAPRGGGASSRASLLHAGPGKRASVSVITMRRVFDKFDVDGNGVLSLAEVRAMLVELGVTMPRAEFESSLRKLAGDRDDLTFEDFSHALLSAVDRRQQRLREMQQRAALHPPPPGEPLRGLSSTGSAFGLVDGGGDNGSSGGGLRSGSGARKPMLNLTLHGATAVLTPPASAGASPIAAAAECADDGDGDAGADDDDELDEETAKMTPGQIKWRAYSGLAVAMLLVTVFSDPMCDVLSEAGTRLQAATGLNNAAFYVAFVVAPIISNASEIVSSVIFAGRKSQKTIVLTYAQLLGAATMNNSFCLAIFLAVVFVKNLEWNYTAEVCAILLVEAIMCAMAYVQKTPLWHALVPAALYPASLGLVYALERGGVK